jgi:RNA polymerase sigma-70 factor (family 1)
MNEEQIISGVNKKEQDAYSMLFHLYYKELCYFAYKIINNREEAKDIVVNNFCSFLEKKDGFESLSHMRGYLFTATKHDCINYLKRHKMKAAKEEQVISIYNPGDEKNWEKLMDQAEILNELYKAIQTLPEQSKKVFSLTHLDGLSRSEVAKLMGLSENTVRNHNATALELLRTALGDKKLQLALLLLHYAFLKN